MYHITLDYCFAPDCDYRFTSNQLYKGRKQIVFASTKEELIKGIQHYGFYDEYLQSKIDDKGKSEQLKLDI